MTQKTKKIKSFFTKKKIILTISVLVTLLIILGITVANRTKTQVKEIFKLNEKLKSEGYYLAEFEFQMLGVVYYLDHGDYIKALSTLNKIHKQLKTKEGLIKIPEFSNKKEKLEFYKKLQNPKTGAFMDDSYPFFSYIGVTANMIAYIEDLSIDANVTFHLSYPLKFLDEINTSEKLIKLLDDISTMGWLGSTMPKSPFVEIGELRELAKDAERLEIYSFSPEWKHTFYQWCYDNQDEETGLWGPRSRGDNKLLKGGDLTDSEKIIKIFIDHDGNQIHPEFPLKYRDKMFASALKKISNPMPEDLDELHDWILTKDRGIRFLTRYLWKKASIEEKEATRKLIDEFIRIRFEHYYIKNENAFSLYPHAEHADLDGVGEAIGMFDYIGALSNEKQKRLWGDPKENVIDLGAYKVLELKKSDFTLITSYSIINSIRLYKIEPNNDYIENVEGIFYPRETKVLDLVQLLPKIENWIKITPQNMGNWISKESVRQKLETVNITPVPVVTGDIPLDFVNKILQEKRKLIAIGFDVLQIPRYKIVYNFVVSTD